MEVKEQRADGGETHEIYTMLMEPDALMRNQRRLRREICVSRIVLIVLLATCMALCAAFYILQVHGSKHIEIPDKEKANETLAERQTGNREEMVDVQTVLVAVAYLRQHSYSARANLKWTGTSVGLKGFSFSDGDESLIIPRDGKYRIGLQITYKGDKQEGQINLAHSITKISDSYGEKNPSPIPILSVYETVYNGKSWIKSVFSDIIHVFCKGDKIKVEVANASVLDNAGQLNTKTFLTVQFISGL